MRKLKKIFTLSLITAFLFVACSKNENVEEVKTQQLRFEKNSNKKIMLGKKSSNQSDFSTYTIKLDSSGKLITDGDRLIIREAVNKENGVKSFVITEKIKSNSTTLNSLRLTAKSNSEESDSSSIERGYWYDGHDCFVYGTIVTADDGTTFFVPANAATQDLMNSCGWGNVG